MHALVERMDRMPRVSPPTDPPSADELTRGVGRITRWLSSGRDCVPRALAVYSILTKYGYDASFVSGVRLVDDDVRSHAWVELHGAAIPRGSDSDGAERYTENFRHRSGGAVPSESSSWDAVRQAGSAAGPCQSRGDRR